jgi:hypothetical protein
MSIQHLISRSARSLAVLSCLALAGACEKEEHDTDGDSAASEGSGSSASNASNASNATEGGSSPTEGGSASSPTSATNDTSSDTNGQACEGDWTLGSVPFSGDPTLGQACDDPNVPKNCADGTYIKFGGTGECICIAQCSSLGVSAGQNCTDDGKWVCAKIEATNASMNSATACVAAAWNICTAGGSSTGGDSASASGGDSASASGGDSASASGGDTGGDTGGGSCLPSGADCSFSSDCCSDDCTFDVCA